MGKKLGITTYKSYWFFFSEQNAPSPKVKQYDVTKIRAYIKSKKEERRKRHLEEHKRKILEEQKIKESLDKLFEYQKQKVKAVPKIKPISPAKVRQD